MIRTILLRWKALQSQRRALAWMLRRSDDRWLRDIGLTRHQLRSLLKDWRD